MKADKDFACVWVELWDGTKYYLVAKKDDKSFWAVRDPNCVVQRKVVVSMNAIKLIEGTEI